MSSVFDFSVAVDNTRQNSLLAEFVEQYQIQSSQSPASVDGSEVDIFLVAELGGIALYQSQDHTSTEKNKKAKKAKPKLKYQIDIDHFVAQQKTFPAAKQGAFNQALGKHSKVIIDATAGWGGDSLLMCAQGYQVSMIERHPIMALLLNDAMQRLAETSWAEYHQVTVPQVVSGDAKQILLNWSDEVDCVYLDPMFPAKRKKSAATNKNMQLLHKLVGADEDANQLLASALQCATKRVAVKRPDYADALTTDTISKPDSQFSSKLLHYDVYLAV